MRLREFMVNPGWDFLIALAGIAGMILLPVVLKLTFDTGELVSALGIWLSFGVAASLLKLRLNLADRHREVLRARPGADDSRTVPTIGSKWNTMLTILLLFVAAGVTVAKLGAT